MILEQKQKGQNLDLVLQDVWLGIMDIKIQVRAHIMTESKGQRLRAPRWLQDERISTLKRVKTLLVQERILMQARIRAMEVHQ